MSEIELEEYMRRAGISNVIMSDTLPDKILAFDKTTCRVGTYVPERTATIVKVPRKDYISIGHYECGLCGASITPVMRYCHGCGAKLEGASE
jgi:hypothetical protein